MRQAPPTIPSPYNPRIATVEQLAALVACPINRLEWLIVEAPSLYSHFSIPKANGKTREICPPAPVLREVQRVFLDVLQKRVKYPRWMMGGVPRRSIFDHASVHVGKKMVATFDVQAFFPSTTPGRVRKIFEDFGFLDAAAEAAVRLVTKDQELPQGSPTSCFLANLALEPADRRLDAISRKHGLSYTRYVDDIAMSGDQDLRKFQSTIVEAVEACGYKLATEKTKYMPWGTRQVVTKLCVNDRLRPTREFIAGVKSLIWECLEFGAAVVAAEHGISVSALKNRLGGKVAHIRGADEVGGRRLRRMLNGVDWNRTEQDFSSCFHSNIRQGQFTTVHHRRTVRG